MPDQLHLYPGESRGASGAHRSPRISFSQFSPRDMPDHPDWPNAPLLTPEERDSLLEDVFEKVYL